VRLAATYASCGDGAAPRPSIPIIRGSWPVTMPVTIAPAANKATTGRQRKHWITVKCKKGADRHTKDHKQHFSVPERSNGCVPYLLGKLGMPDRWQLNACLPCSKIRHIRCLNSQGAPSPESPRPRGSCADISWSRGWSAAEIGCLVARLPAHAVKGISKAMLPRMTNVKACRHEGAAFTRRLGSDSEASAPTA
jgi:hypothetical protein